MKMAWERAEELPAFANVEEATSALIAEKDSILGAFLANPPAGMQLDLSPESLKAVEAWYLTTEHRAPPVRALGFYFGEVLCRNAGFAWIVEPYFLDNSRYEIGVRKGLVTLMLTKGVNRVLTGNKRMQSLYRDFKQYQSVTSS